MTAREQAEVDLRSQLSRIGKSELRRGERGGDLDFDPKTARRRREHEPLSASTVHDPPPDGDRTGQATPAAGILHERCHGDADPAGAIWTAPRRSRDVDLDPPGRRAVSGVLPVACG